MPRFFPQKHFHCCRLFFSFCLNCRFNNSYRDTAERLWLQSQGSHIITVSFYHLRGRHKRVESLLLCILCCFWFGVHGVIEKRKRRRRISGSQVICKNMVYFVIPRASSSREILLRRTFFTFLLHFPNRTFAMKLFEFLAHWITSLCSQNPACANFPRAFVRIASSLSATAKSWSTSSALSQTTGVWARIAIISAEEILCIKSWRSMEIEIFFAIVKQKENLRVAYRSQKIIFCGWGS